MDLNRHAAIMPQPRYKQTINVGQSRDDRFKTSENPSSSSIDVDETVQKLTKPKSDIQSRLTERHYLCQNQVHAATRRSVKATRILPCTHTFCEYCFDLDKAIIAGYVHCLKCKKQCRLQDIVKIDAELNRETIDAKTKEHTETQEKANIRRQCNYRNCQQKQVRNAYETILLSCNHRFCHRCVSKSIRPETTMEEYLCIKCPNCEEDNERWYTDAFFEPFFKENGENYQFYKTLNRSQGSFMDEIKCIIKQTDIYLETKRWKRKDELTINVWCALTERMYSEYKLEPDNDGLYTVEIPIEREIYFFKISSIHGTKWLGPVEPKLGIPPTIKGNVEIDHISPNSIELSWMLGKPYKYIAIDGCSIEKWSAEKDVWEPFYFVKYPGIRCRIENLNEKTRYTLRLICCTSAGNTKCSNFDVETKPGTGNIRGKPFAPNDFTIKYYGINIGVFTWKEPPYIFTHKVLKYILEMKEGDGNWEKVGEVENACSIRCPFQMMEYGKYYYFRIAALNSFGRSEPCELYHNIRRKPSHKLQEIGETVTKMNENSAKECSADKIREKEKKTNVISASQSQTGKEKDKKMNEIPASQGQTEKETDKKAKGNSASQSQTGKEKEKKLNDNSASQTGKEKDKKTTAISASQSQTDKETDRKTNSNSASQSQNGKENDKKTNDNSNEGMETNKNSTSECQTGKEKEKNTNKYSASKCQTDEHEDTKNEEGICSKCCELKALECILSCDHKYCLECSLYLCEHALECDDGKQSVFIWVCKSCEMMTGENFVEFTGTILNKNLLVETRKNSEQQKPKTEDVQGNSIPYDKCDVGTKEKIRGLPNVGMTCYSNCIFQILAQTHCFYNHLEALVMDYNLDKTKSVTGLLLRTLSEINRESGDEWSNRVDYETIVRLIKTISQSDQSFQRGEQADCHSFMMALFNAIKAEIQLTEERPEKSKTGQASKQNPEDLESDKKTVEPTERTCSLTRDTRGMLVEKLAKRNKEKPLIQFEGYTTNIFFYDSCKHREVTERQLFNSLLIPIEDTMFGNWTLCKGLGVLQKRETFSEDLVPCGICNIGVHKCYQRSSWLKNFTEKKLIFTKLPDVLVLQLGKFERGYHIPVKKIYAKVEYPHQLKLKEYNDPDTKREFSEKTYRLYGVTLHSGTIYGGHYSAYVRCKDKKDTQSKTQEGAQWFYCSDSYIKKVSEEKVINNSKAAVLFYELVDLEHNF